MSIVRHNGPFFVYIDLLNFFCSITENELYGGQGNTRAPQGLPYEAMLTKVNETITACNATLAKLPYPWPTEEQKNAMTKSLFWGKGGTSGEYSLELNVAPPFLNSDFIRCFNEKITEWAQNYEHSLNQGLMVAMIIIGVVVLTSAVIGGLYLYCKRNNKHSGYTHIGENRLFTTTAAKPAIAAVQQRDQEEMHALKT